MPNQTHRALVVLLLALLSSTNVLADDLTSVLLPPKLPKLPSPESTDQLPIIAENEELFRELLLASTSNWLSTGRFRMQVYSRLNYEIETSLSEEADDALPAIQSVEQIESALLTNPRQPNTFPFGSARVINLVPDLKLRARKILWNSLFANQVAAAFAYDMQLFWFSGNQPPREAAGTVKRVFESTQNLKPEDMPVSAASQWSEAELFFAESFRLTAPPAIFGFQRVSFRSLKRTRDILWSFSPALGKTREMLEANRGDGFLEGILSLDDLFVFSGKAQRYEARVVADKLLFMPFASLQEQTRSGQSVFAEPEQPAVAEVAPAATTEATLQPAAKLEPVATPTAAKEVVQTFFGEHQTFDGTRAMVQWNFQGRVASEYPLWLPNSVVFVPRRVWIVELHPSDPFYRFGRVVLAIDQETFLPHFAVSYDRRGNYQKTVMGIWGHGRLESGEQVPILGGLLAVDRTVLRATVQSTSFVNIGSAKTPLFTEEIWKEIRNKQKSPQDEAAGESKTEPAAAPAAPAAGTPAEPVGGVGAWD
jgi:hypothetical protein